MKKIILLIIMIISIFLVIRSNLLAEYSYGESECNLTPTLDPESKTKVYIPFNLEDAFKELKHMLTKDILNEIKNGSEEDMINYHFSLGLWIRNNWGFYEGSRLSKYFNNIGIRRPDDMSGIILETFWRYINSKPLQLEEKVNYYLSRKSSRE